jgi:hypothetical protein
VNRSVVFIASLKRTPPPLAAMRSVKLVVSTTSVLPFPVAA